VFNWDAMLQLKSTTPLDITTFTTLCDQDSKIIDLGCGYGRICSVLESLGYKRLVGVDLSQIQLERAKTYLHYTKLVCTDVRKLPFDSSEFDHAITFGVINCLIETEELRKFIKECSRIVSV
jgi:SAM-dependent methyltransferase